MKKWVEDMNTDFSKDIQMANRHMKRCSKNQERPQINNLTLYLKELQVKTTISYLTPVRMAEMNKTRNNNFSRSVKKREPFCTVGGNAN